MTSINKLSSRVRKDNNDLSLLTINEMSPVYIINTVLLNIWIFDDIIGSHN